MTYRVSVVCRPDVARGFALAGLGATEVSDVTEAAGAVAEHAADPDVGILLIEESLHDALPEEMRRAFGRRAVPMIVPFPGPSWAEAAGEAEGPIVELLRQAIGYRVRVR